MANREGKKIRGSVKEINLTVYPDKRNWKEKLFEEILKKEIPRIEGYDCRSIRVTFINAKNKD